MKQNGIAFNLIDEIAVAVAAANKTPSPVEDLLINSFRW